MRHNLIAAYEKSKVQAKALPAFRPGDTVRIHYKILEGSGKDNKFRIQLFEGVVIRYKKGTIDSTFTVRKIGANNVGIERVFPAQSPFLDKVEVISSGIVRRSRLFYLRKLSGKAARIRSRFGGREQAPAAQANS